MCSYHLSLSCPVILTIVFLYCSKTCFRGWHRFCLSTLLVSPCPAGGGQAHLLALVLSNRLSRDLPGQALPQVGTVASAASGGRLSQLLPLCAVG